MGLPAMGTHRAQLGPAEPSSRLQPSPAAGRDARLGTRWVPTHQAEMLSTQGCCIPLAPGRPVPEGQAPAAPAGLGQGTYGDLLLRVASAAAHAGSPCWEEEGFFGMTCWLCLCLLGAGTRCPAPQRQCYHGRIRPSHAHAMQTVTTCLGHRPARPCSPSPGRVDPRINNGGSPVPAGSGTGSGPQLQTCVLLTLPAHSTGVWGWRLPCHPTHPLYPAHPSVGRVLSPPKQLAGLCQPSTGRICWAGSSTAGRAGRGTGQDSARHAWDVAKCFATGVQTMYRTPLTCTRMRPH